MAKRNRRAGVEDRWRRADGQPTARAGTGLRWLGRYVADDGKERTKSFGRKGRRAELARRPGVGSSDRDVDGPDLAAQTFEAVAETWIATKAHRKAEDGRRLPVATRHGDPAAMGRRGAARHHVRRATGLDRWPVGGWRLDALRQAWPVGLAGDPGAPGRQRRAQVRRQVSLRCGQPGRGHRTAGQVRGRAALPRTRQRTDSRSPAGAIAR